MTDDTLTLEFECDSKADAKLIIAALAAAKRTARSDSVVADLEYFEVEAKTQAVNHYEQ